MTGRPSLDQTFMDIATITSWRATCPKASVGCVIVKDQHIISCGYNGAPPGMPHCIDVGCEYQKEHRAIHAEENAVAFAAKNGLPIEGSTLYITHAPCARCAKLLISAGVKRVVFKQLYETSHTTLLIYADVEVEQFEGD